MSILTPTVPDNRLSDYTVTVVPPECTECNNILSEIALLLNLYNTQAAWHSIMQGGCAGLMQRLQIGWPAQHLQASLMTFYLPPGLCRP